MSSLYDMESASQMRQPKPSGEGGPLGHLFHRPINLPSVHGIRWCWLLSLVTEEPRWTHLFSRVNAFLLLVEISLFFTSHLHPILTVAICVTNLLEIWGPDPLILELEQL